MIGTMKYIMRISRLAILCLLVQPSCKEGRSALPIGMTKRARSLGIECSYTAAPTVAVIDAESGAAKLVGPGIFVSNCDGARVEWDVLAPTGIRIDDGTSLSDSPKSISFQATLLAGKRELLDDECTDFQWTLGADCVGVATRGGHESHPIFCPTGAVVVEQAAGTCTLEVAALGHHATKKLVLR